jgi:maltogenic amylase-like protein
MGRCRSLAKLVPASDCATTRVSRPSIARSPFLDVGPEANVLAYLRRAEKPSDSIVVILNYGAEPALVPLRIDGEPLPGGKFIDLLTGDEITPDGTTIAIAGQSVRVLKAE